MMMADPTLTWRTSNKREGRRQISDRDAQRIRRGQLEQWELYIGRAHAKYGIPRSKWANPFPIAGKTSRQEALEKFNKYFWGGGLWLAQGGRRIEREGYDLPLPTGGTVPW